MPDFESTMEWKVDVTSFTKAMREAKTALEESNRQFNLTVSTMDRWSDNVDGLEAKIKNLKDQIQAGSRIVEIYKNAWEEAKEEFGETSPEAERLQKLIDRQQITVNKAEVSLNKYTSQLNDMNAEQSEGISKYDELNAKITEQQRKVDDLKKQYASAVIEFGKTSDEAKELARQLQSASDELTENKQKMNDAEKAADNLNDEIKETGESASVAANGGFTVLKGALANLVTQGFNRVIDAAKTLAKSALSYENEIEGFRVSFEVMTGSADKASEMITRLSRIVRKTPFDMPTLANTTQLLMNYGISADEAMDKMMMLGDIAQGNSEKLGRIALAYGQMSSAGKVHLQDIKQMIEAGFNPLQLISDKTGESMESLYKRISKGTISVDEIKEAFVDATSAGGKYYQSMDKQSQTFQGRLEAVKEQTNETFGKVLQPFLQKLSDRLLPRVTKLLNNIDTTKMARGLSDFGDKIVDAFDWIIENGKDALDVLKAIAVAFVTYKAVSIIGGVVSSFNTLISAIKTGETVMKALNLAFGASPIGLLAVGIAGLAGGMWLLTKRNQEAIEAQYGLNDAEQESIDKITELTATYNDLNTVRKERMSDSTAEFAYINDLKEEYNGLIDTNGKVKEGYEDRAKFILTTLAEAMGMELDDIQKLIDQNGKLGDSIDEVIKKKQAEAILAANEQIYNQAIKERSGVLAELTDAQNVLDEAEKRYISTKSEAQKVWDNYYDMMKYAPDAADEYLRANSKIILGNEEARKSYDDAKQAVADAEGAWIGYNSVIQNYEGLAAAIISGDSEKIQEAMRNMQYGFITAETGNRESLERQVENYKNNLAALEKAIEDGTPSVTQDMVDQAKSMVDAAEKELDKLPPEASKKGEEASKDFAEGVGSKEKDAEEKGKAMAKAAVKGAGSENGEKGGAKKSGENFGEGYANGMKSESILTKVGNAAKGLAKRALAWLRREQQEGSPSKLTRQSGIFFGEGYEGGILSMIRPVVSAAGTMAKQAVEALGSNMGDQMRAMGAENANSWMTGFNSADISSAIGNLKANMYGQNSTLMGGATGSVGSVTGSNQQIVTFNQTINSPKAVDRLTLYRETNSLLFSAKVRLSDV